MNRFGYIILLHVDVVKNNYHFDGEIYKVFEKDYRGQNLLVMLALLSVKLSYFMDV